MSLRILVVDDSRLARMSVAKALTASHPDWERLEAANADEAIGIVKGNPVDIALVDFNMPGRDGLELAAELRELAPRMPVAVVSANHQDEVLRRARNVGATFLVKPLTQKAIDDFLTEAVARLEAQN
ncbi:MAG TPA: response regulator [Micropepsaceae bacterium]|nr:response regulator [Micropepsaceae bacterium]